MTREGLQYFSEPWLEYDVFQRAWLARFMDASLSGNVKASKDVMRKIRGKRLMWQLTPKHQLSQQTIKLYMHVQLYMHVLEVPQEKDQKT